ncbi:MAG: type I-U CRISPR-associated protein Cas5/Cas6 [Acidimicrobiaceae bacterium]|nr:type I-U CRISPR-associated protein Cas5/Cas6 [Acidimicrobiaceae bacterium]
MTVIEVNFLTGRCVATAHHDRTEPEWPPHGARLFSAMVAAWADADEPDESERAALEWLETLPPPRINAPEEVERRVVSHFVPVNDVSVLSGARYAKLAGDLEELLEQYDDELQRSGGMSRKVERLEARIAKVRDVSSLTDHAGKTSRDSAVAMLPDRVGAKKERYFPSVTLVGTETSEYSADQGPLSPPTRLVPPVTFAWDESAPPDTAASLDGLLGRVTRLGHSSSLVSCRLRDDEPPATHTPGEGVLMLRWVRPRQLAALEHEHQRHRAIRTRSLPFRGARYRAVEDDEAVAVYASRPSTAGDWIVFELEPRHRRLPMTRAVELTRVLRESILKHVPDPLPEGVSGHLANGKPTTAPHISFLALPNVAHEHGDGRIMGLALSLPDGLDETARRATLRGVGLWERERGEQPLQLTMGRGGVVEMRRRQPPFALASLRPPVWAGASRWWASVTPVALPTHPGDLRRGSPSARAKAWARAEAAVARSCEHVGLPSPTSVQVSLAPHWLGARPATDYPTFRQGRGAGTVRRLVHTIVEFAEPIRGPLVLGSGRFLGLGLMRLVGEPAMGDRGEGGGAR